MSVAKYQNEYFGASPWTVEGPFILGNGVPSYNYSLGSVTVGDAEAEWVMCKLVLAAATTFQTGALVQWDKDYNASLLTTANAVLGNRVGVITPTSIAPTLAGTNTPITVQPGTYYVWVQRAGQVPMFVSAVTTPNLPGSFMETTVVPGQGNVPAVATVGSKQIAPVAFAQANTTFTANTVNGSNVLTSLVGANTASGPFLGATLNGVGVAGLTVIGLTYLPSGTVSSMMLSGPATANGAAIVMTATGVLEASLQWPMIVKSN